MREWGGGFHDESARFCDGVVRIVDIVFVRLGSTCFSGGLVLSNYAVMGGGEEIERKKTFISGSWGGSDVDFGGLNVVS